MALVLSEDGLMRAAALMAARAAGCALLVGLGAGALLPVAASAAPDGGTLFKQRCQSCHSGPTSPIAPNLAGVVGRKAAATNFRYSPALKASGITWTKPNLDRFLTGPQQMVPGTRMVIRVGDPAERTAIITYLVGKR